MKDQYRIVLHPEGDWEGLYKNGKLINEGHSGMEEILLDILNEEGLLDYASYYAKMEKNEDGYWPSNMPDELPEKE